MNEEYEEQNALLKLLEATAPAAGIAGLGTAATLAERARRHSNATGLSYQDSFKTVARDAAQDLNTARQVIFGQTDYDLTQREPAREASWSGDQQTKAQSYGSLRDWATSSDPQVQRVNTAYSSLNTPGADYIPNPLTQASISMRDAFMPGSEDFLGFKRESRLRRGQSPEGPKWDTVVGRVPLFDAIRDILPSNRGGFSAEERAHRKNAFQ